jgi:hypothetical protein
MLRKLVVDAAVQEQMAVAEAMSSALRQAARRR